MTESEHQYQTASLTSDLTKIKGIGTSAMEKLYQAGIHNIEELAQKTPKELSLIKGIGTKTAEAFIDQALQLASPKETISEQIEEIEIEPIEDLEEREEIEEKIESKKKEERFKSEPKEKNAPKKEKITSSTEDYTIPSSVSQLNSTQNKYSREEKTKASESKSQTKKPNLKMKINLKDYNYSKFTCKGYETSNTYKQEINTLSTHLLYVSVPTLGFGILFIVLLNILPFSSIGILLSIGGLGLIGFLVAMVGLFALFYKHKFKITPECKDKKVTSSQKKSRQSSPDPDTNLEEENELLELEQEPNQNDEFQKYLKEDPIETPFEEKYLKKYGTL